MAAPEYPHSNRTTVSTELDFLAALAELDRQLEWVDACENPIERLAKREELLEERDSLEHELHL
jgi:hypothetical protein